MEKTVTCFLAATVPIRLGLVSFLTEDSVDFES